MLGERSQTQKAVCQMILFIQHSGKSKRKGTKNGSMISTDQRLGVGGGTDYKEPQKHGGEGDGSIRFFDVVVITCHIFVQNS